MASVTVQNAQEPEGAASLSETMSGMLRDVRQRAFDLFQHQGGAGGSDLDNWLRAERELIWKPESELLETEKEFQMKVAAPDVEAKDIIISALPESIVVQARCMRKERQEQGAPLSVLSERRLFRRFDLRPGIDVGQVKATLENGVLTIAAAKLPEVKETRIPVVG
jgi:HSP20 family molecular chaperone IbpA